MATAVREALLRKRAHVPLAEGWRWYTYQDGYPSDRWVTDGRVFACTDCGEEYERPVQLPGHNRGHDALPSTR